ncbi:unnamed protein product, partial [Closterium sp. Naga37s-1]
GSSTDERELFDPPDVLATKVKELARLLKTSRYAMVYTGAGISTSAGIPDYRGPNGVWTLRSKGIQVKEPNFLQVSPTLSHFAFTVMVQAGVVRHVVSQNIDGLHRRSGLRSQEISELHGNFCREVCARCGAEFFRGEEEEEEEEVEEEEQESEEDEEDDEEEDEDEEDDEEEEELQFDHRTGRMCEVDGCGGELEDCVVLFGECLPNEVLLPPFAFPSLNSLSPLAPSFPFPLPTQLSPLMPRPPRPSRLSQPPRSLPSSLFFCQMCHSRITMPGSSLIVRRLAWLHLSGSDVSLHPDSLLPIRICISPIPNFPLSPPPLPFLSSPPHIPSSLPLLRPPAIPLPSLLPVPNRPLLPPGLRFQPLKSAKRHSDRADVALVMGSSLRVGPACNFPASVPRHGGRLVIINLQPTPIDARAELVRARGSLRGEGGEVGGNVGEEVRGGGQAGVMRGVKAGWSGDGLVCGGEGIETAISMPRSHCFGQITSG